MVNHIEFREALDQIYVLACSNNGDLEECLLELKDLIENQHLDDFRGYTSEECDTLLENYFQNPQRASNEEIKQNIENLIDYIPETNDERSVIEINIQHILKNSSEESCPLQLLYRITNTLNDNLVLRPAYEANMGNIINLMLNELENGSELPESLKRAYEHDLEQKLSKLEGYVENVENVVGVNETDYDAKGDNFSIYIEPTLDRDGLKQALSGFPAETRLKEFVAVDHELWKRGRNLPIFRTNLPTYKIQTQITHHAPGSDAYAEYHQRLESQEMDIREKWNKSINKQLETRVSEFDKQLDTLFGALNVPKGQALDAIAPYLSQHIPNWLTESRKNSGKSIIFAALKQEREESIHSYTISTDNIKQADDTFNTLVRTIEYMSDPIFALNMFEEEVTAESVLNYEFIDGNRLSKSKYVTETLQTEMIDSVIALYNLNRQHNSE